MDGAHGGDSDDRYLAGLAPEQRDLLTQVNRLGLERLRELLAGGGAVAFLGAGASAPLYPLWGKVIAQLVNAAADRLGDRAAATCRAMASELPDAVVEVIRQRLGSSDYQEVLRKAFAPRRDPDTGRAWTTTHELVARCDFAGVVTTNYDAGIVNARIAVRPQAAGTGFASWTDDGAMDRWRSGDVFGDDELPVLYAHGQHNQPDAIVLAITEYRRAYGGKLGKVLGTVLDVRHAVWIGFSFADERIRMILREVAESAGSSFSPGAAPRHVAIMPWDPSPVAGGDALDPDVVRALIEIPFASRVVLYPAPSGDHSALQLLLEELVDPRFAATSSPAPAARSAAGAAASSVRRTERWAHGGERVEHFTGRADELARLERWAGDNEVRLVGVTAWGGAGKTALVTEWLTRDGAASRSALRGLFAWSFNEDPSAENWAEALIEWAQETFGVRVGDGQLASRILSVAAEVPLALVLDGLEAMQEEPEAARFGRLLDGPLRPTLTGLCQLDHRGLVIVTSRFPFADLEQFDGGPARMLDVSPFTRAEGAALLGRAGGGWLPADARERLVRGVDGHALAVVALAGALAAEVPTNDVQALCAELEQAPRTDVRVSRVLRFYADRLAEEDRTLVALVSLFPRPVAPAAILALGTDVRLGAPLRGWDAGRVQAAVRQHLAGLLVWHDDGTISAHPLVRGTFRPLMLTGVAAQLVAETSLHDLPDEAVNTRAEALRVVEMIELLIDAGEWEGADTLYTAGTANGYRWMTLPASALGQRCAMAFVGTEARRAACGAQLSPRRCGFYINEAGLFSASAGDLTTGQRFLELAIELAPSQGTTESNISVRLVNLSRCHAYRGDADGSLGAAARALTHAEAGDDQHRVLSAHCHLGAARDLMGATALAEEHLLVADRMEWLRPTGAGHLYSLSGITWGRLLLRTGRVAVARRLTEANRNVCLANDWTDDVMGCESLLAACDLHDDDVQGAGCRLSLATQTLRDGEFLMELATVLPELAEQRRRAGDLDEAERVCSEAAVLASPRQLVPSHAAALAVRARVRGDRHAAGGNQRELMRARDDADLALRLATVIRRLPWAELEALDAHAHLDELAGAGGGEWARRARDLRNTLVPAGLDPDPLATVEAEGPSVAPSRLGVPSAKPPGE